MCCLLFTAYLITVRLSYAHSSVPLILISVSKKLCSKHLLILSIFRLEMYDEDLQHFRDLKDPSFRGIYTVSEIKAGYYNKLQRHDTESYVSISKQRLMMVPIVFHLRKHSCLTAPINNRLEKLVNSGLMEHWVDEYRDAKYSTVRKIRTPQTLTMDQIKGIFYICAALHATALIVFVVEFLAHKFSFDRLLKKFI